MVAIAVNLAVGQVAATWLGFPRWIGTIAAGGAMAAASMPAMRAEASLEEIFFGATEPTA